MKLGQFLADAPEAPTRPVKFPVVWVGEAGTQTKAQANAVLAFLDDMQTREALLEAANALREEYGSEPPPADVREDERIYQILFRALRDADDPRQKFARSLVELRKAVLPTVAGNLWLAYRAFVQEEFPENVSGDEFRAMVKEAEGE